MALFYPYYLTYHAVEPQQDTRPTSRNWWARSASSKIECGRPRESFGGQEIDGFDHKGRWLHAVAFCRIAVDKHDGWDLRHANWLVEISFTKWHSYFSPLNRQGLKHESAHVLKEKAAMGCHRDGWTWSVSFGLVYLFRFSTSYRRKFRSQTSDNMDRWKSRGGKSQRRRRERRKKIREEKESEERRCRCAKR